MTFFISKARPWLNCDTMEVLLADKATKYKEPEATISAWIGFSAANNVGTPFSMPSFETQTASIGATPFAAS